MIDTVETGVLRAMIEACGNPDVKHGIQSALGFIEASGYYNLTDWDAMIKNGKICHE